jgi:GH25 family lysozyme M1 (1,4-beta-N-acetylmuramidase)
MPVTYADKFDGPTTVSQLETLGLPQGCTVWLDVEGLSVDLSAQQVINQINAWADEVSAAGYQPGIYVGSNALLTSLELYQLHVVRYWHSMSAIVDRNGQLAQPGCGWCQFQLFDTTIIAGVSVDVNFIQKDWQGRVPSWVVAA